MLGGCKDARETIDSVTDRALIAQCAYAVGGMDALLEKTIAYVGAQVQFGKPLSANQVLRHNATKIWTTHAHFATMKFALVRTSDCPRKQNGISFILIDV